jgi:acyl-CoA thioester hydrolase
MASPSIPFCSIQRVYFDDLDALGLLHNVRYLLFIERARFEMFDAFGFRWGASLDDNPDKMHVVAGHEVKYLRPVTELGDLCVALSPQKMGTTSFTVHARVQSLDGTRLFAEVTTRLVRIDAQTKRPCAWSDRFRRALAPLSEG